jgi:hypothetical protein
MQNKTVSYGVSPLPQADYPVNLYKRSPSQSTFPNRPNPEAPILNRSTESPIPQPPRLESSRPRQSPAIGQQQLDEAQAIAQRVGDTSGSSRLEYLLRRQQSKRYEQWQQQPLRALEFLAIARRTDGCYQIAIRGTKTPFSRYVFETLEYCREAATELEQRFEIEGMLEFLDGVVQEHVEAIVLAAVWRERVEKAVCDP